MELLEVAGFMSGAMSVFIMVTTFIVVGFYALLTHIFTAIALKRVADNLGCEKSWLAWLPYGQQYINGWVGDQIMHQNGESDWYLRWIGLGGMVLFPTAGYVACYIAAYKLFRKYTPDKAVMYLVISILCNLLMPIFLLNAAKKMPPMM